VAVGWGRRLIVVAQALAIATTAALWGPVSPADAKTRLVKGSGVVVCDVMNGSLHFSPALSGSQPVTGSLSWTLTGTSCGNVGESTDSGLTVSKVVLKGTTPFGPVDQCFSGQVLDLRFSKYTATYTVKPHKRQLMPTIFDGVLALKGVSSPQGPYATLSTILGEGSFTGQHSTDARVTVALLSGGLCSGVWTADPRGSFLSIVG